jgi:hypothetical protein
MCSSSPLAADAPATASNKGFFGYLFGLIYFLVKCAARALACR